MQAKHEKETIVDVQSSMEVVNHNTGDDYRTNDAKGVQCKFCDNYMEEAVDIIEHLRSVHGLKNEMSLLLFIK